MQLKSLILFGSAFVGMATGLATTALMMKVTSPLDKEAQTISANLQAQTEKISELEKSITDYWMNLPDYKAPDSYFIEMRQEYFARSSDAGEIRKNLDEAYKRTHDANGPYMLAEAIETALCIGGMALASRIKDRGNS
jgi:hypothetical protein